MFKKRVLIFWIIANMFLSIGMGSCMNWPLPVDMALPEYRVLLNADSTKVKDIACGKVLVLDADYFSSKDIQYLRAKGCQKIYSYLNVGSVEKFRDYYKDFEDITLGEYENWPEEKWVDVSNKKWQESIQKRAKTLLQKGVDGFFIDNTDVYYFYKEKKIYDGLVDILNGLSNLKKSVIINGGDCFVKEYLEKSNKRIFTGVNQESVYTRYDFENEAYKKNNIEDRDYFTQYLETVEGFGYEVYVIEYANNKKLQEEAYQYCKKRGFHVYVSNSIDLK